jgi:hypothetical protein
MGLFWMNGPSVLATKKERCNVYTCMFYRQNQCIQLNNLKKNEAKILKGMIKKKGNYKESKNGHKRYMIGLHTPFFFSDMMLGL